MSIDPLENPYAPPAAAMAAPPVAGLRRDATSSYAGERRSVMLLVLFCIITFGFYPAVWFFRRRRFLDSLDSTAKLGLFAAAPLVATVVSYALALAQTPSASFQLVRLASAIVTLATSFRVAGILRSDFARTGRFLQVSGVGTFFFGVLYLQQKINEAAGTPPREVAGA